MFARALTHSPAGGCCGATASAQRTISTKTTLVAILACKLLFFIDSPYHCAFSSQLLLCCSSRLDFQDLSLRIQKEKLVLSECVSWHQRECDTSNYSDNERKSAMAYKLCARLCIRDKNKIRSSLENPAPQRLRRRFNINLA